MLSLARKIDGELPMSMRWDTMQEFVKEGWREEFEQHGLDEVDQEFDELWHAALEAGVWGKPGSTIDDQLVPSSASTIAAIANPISKFAGDEDEYPFVLHPFLTATFLDGRGANLPWLQELPDPIGQGHTTYGRFAKERGVNPVHIVATLMDDQAGVLAWAATRVKIQATGERLPVIKTDGVTRTLGRQILGPKNDHA